jgi:hypothetical protein
MEQLEPKWMEFRNLVKNFLQMKMFININDKDIKEDLLQYTKYFADTLEFFDEILNYTKNNSFLIDLIKFLE